MNRKQAAEEVKNRWREILPLFTNRAKKNVNGEPSYICPLCKNGSGGDGDGITLNPKSKRRTGLKCFKCGFSGSVIDLVMQAGGHDYNMAVEMCADMLHIPLEAEKGPFEAGTGARDKKPDREENAPKRAEFSGYTGTTAAPQGIAGALDEIQNPFTLPADLADNTAAATEKAGDPADAGADPAQLADYTAYYRACRARLEDPADPAGLLYLQGRGISAETGRRFWAGYDAETGFFILPVSPYFYIARNMKPGAKKRYKNPKDTTIEIFNRKALYSGAAAVFVFEGAFNALSAIEAGAEAIALNSTSNAGKLLQELEKEPTAATLIICMDDDDAGRKAAQKLASGLDKLGLRHISANVAGEYSDANDALIADRQAFTLRVKEAIAAAKEEAAQRAGILTAGRARQILAEADDTFLALPRFPELAKTVKIKRHDTIALAADTGAGKSSLALNFLHELNDRHPVIYFNLEMDESTIIQRLVAIHTGIDLDRIEGYKQDENTREKVNAAIDEITGRQEIRLLNDVYTLDEIEKTIKDATAGREDPTIAFIDTGLLVKTGTKTGSRYERFTLISEELRRISRLNNVIMFVLLQMNREGKATQNKPTNSSLKESGSWENDATKIIFLWDDPETPKDKKTLLITKNRSGKIGEIEVNYTPHTQTYSEPGGAFLPDDGQAPFNQDADGWTTYTGSGEPATPGNSGRVRY